MDDKEKRVIYIPDVVIIVVALALSVASFGLGYVVALQQLVMHLHK